MRVTTVSEFGLRREAEYGSAADFARALVAQLPDESRDVVADVRVREDGRYYTTHVHVKLTRRRTPTCYRVPLTTYCWDYWDYWDYWLLLTTTCH